MTRTASERSKIFGRCNYHVSATCEAHDAIVTQEQVQKGVINGLLALVENAVQRIEQEGQAEAVLRELWASLLEIRSLRARDPGVRMAAQDLYDAAVTLIMDKRAGAAVVDIRRWRLLKEALLRLRCRLEVDVRAA